MAFIMAHASLKVNAPMGAIFKSQEHSSRFRKSAEILDFEVPYSTDHLDQAKAETVKANGLINCYVRPVAWRGSEMMAVAAQNSTINVAIAVWDWPSMFDMATKMKGIKLDIAEYCRPDPRTSPSMAKAAGLYMICTISKHRAERRGFADALMYDWQGRVAECAELMSSLLLMALCIPQLLTAFLTALRGALS